MLNLFSETALTKVLAASTTATTTVNSGVVGNAGYDGLAFITNIGTANAGNYFKVQGGNESDGSDLTDLAGSEFVPTTNGQAVFITVERSPYAYHQLVCVRAGATTTLGDIYSLLYRTKSAPTGANSALGEQLVTPEAGTA